MKPQDLIGKYFVENGFDLYRVDKVDEDRGRIDFVSLHGGVMTSRSISDIMEGKDRMEPYKWILEG